MLVFNHIFITEWSLLSCHGIFWNILSNYYDQGQESPFTLKNVYFFTQQQIWKLVINTKLKNIFSLRRNSWCKLKDKTIFHISITSMRTKSNNELTVLTNCVCVSIACYILFPFALELKKTSLFYWVTRSFITMNIDTSIKNSQLKVYQLVFLELSTAS